MHITKCFCRSRAPVPLLYCFILLFAFTLQSLPGSKNFFLLSVLIFYFFLLYVNFFVYICTVINN